MTDVPGSGVGNAARDLKTGRTLVSYEEWMAAVKGCWQSPVLALEATHHKVMN